jgi:sporulation integral membrane protein YtvI
LKLLRAASWAAGALGAVWLLRLALPYVWPFGLGLLLALAAEPAVGWLDGRGLERGWAAGLVIGGGLASGVGACVWLARSAAVELGRLDLLSRALETTRHLDRLAANLPPGVRRLMEEELRRAAGTVGPLLAAAAGSLRRWAFGDLAGALFGLLVALLTSYFLSRDRQAVSRALAAALPASWNAALVRVRGALTASVWGFLRAEMLLVALTFLATWAGLALLGAPYALLAALAAAALDLLPVVGPSLLFVPWAAGAWLSGMPGAALALLGLYGGISLVRWVATPRVFGRRLGLHPLTVLVSVYLGLRAFGVSGLLLGPLVAVAARAALEPPAS